MTDTRTNELPRGPLLLLLGLGAAESLLAIFQWVELVALRHGGKTLCAINDVLNCEAVWNSPAAAKVHEWLGMPVAALGLVWGFAATFLVAALVVGQGKAQAQRAPAVVPAVRLLAGVGVLAAVGFGAVSLTNRNLCPTCLVTYLLVLAFAAVVRFRLPGPRSPSQEQLPRTMLWTIAPVLGAYVLLLVPGILTPHAAEEKGAQEIARVAEKAATPEAAGDPLSSFLSQLAPMEAQALSDMLEAYRHGRSVMTQPPPRVLKGPANAPLRIVEFTDIRCGHCRALVETLNALEQAVPPGSFSVDARHFPLDSECNPAVPSSDKTGIRCLGAKAQICLEGAPDYWRLRDQLFSEQATLTPERILQIASSGSVGRAQLEACVKAPETTQKLLDDVRYAAQVNPEGTPILLLNGKQAVPMPALLYVLALTGGNADAPALARLPKPAVGALGGE